MKKKLSLPARDAALDALQVAGVPYEEKSAGFAKSYVTIGSPVVLHFWPSTQRWNVAGSPHNGKGVSEVLEWLRKHHPKLLKTP